MRRILAILTTTIIIFAGVTASAQSPKLMLFGGRAHDVYLGCLNCGSFAADSVCNSFGRYGSEFSGDSVWNQFSRFGNPFAAESPWNAFGVQAPAILDSDGNFYGYFSANEFHQQRTQVKALVTVLSYVGKLKLTGVRKQLCG